MHDKRYPRASQQRAPHYCYHSSDRTTVVLSAASHHGIGQISVSTECLPPPNDPRHVRGAVKAVSLGLLSTRREDRRSSKSTSPSQWRDHLLLSAVRRVRFILSGHRIARPDLTDCAVKSGPEKSCHSLHFHMLFRLMKTLPLRLNPLNPPLAPHQSRFS